MGGVCKCRAAEAGAHCLAHDDFAAGPHGDADLGGVESRHLASLPFGPHASGRKGPTVPAVVAENPVGLGDDVPTLEIAECRALVRSRLDVLVFELGSQRPALFGAERHYFVLTLSWS